MYALSAAIALSSLAAALPQASPVTANPPSASATLAPPVERSANFTISIQHNAKAGLNGFTLNQGHIAAGQNALIFERPSVYPGYESYLYGTPADLRDGHAFLFQYLPGTAGVAYGVKVPAAGKPGQLQLVTGEPGNQTEQFGVSEATKALSFYNFQPDTAFFACADSVAGIKDTLFLKYGTSIKDSDIPAGCDKVELYVNYH